MANLTATAQSIKKIAPVLIFGLIILILVGAIIYRLTNKPKAPLPAPINPPEITQNPSQQQPNSYDFSQLKTAEIPKELPIYMTRLYNVTDAVAKSLAEGFGLGGEPRIQENTLDGRQYSWSFQDHQLTINQKSLIFSAKAPPKPDNLALEQIQDAASFFIQKIPLFDTDLELKQDKIKYLVDRQYWLVNAGTFEAAEKIEFSFDKKLSGLSLLDAVPESTYATVRVRKDGEVVYLSTRLSGGFTQDKIYPIKSAQEAIEEIKNGKGKVVQTQLLDEYGQAVEPFRSQPQTIQLAEINKLELAYFLPDDLTEPVQPIFVAEGTFKIGSENGRVVIYLPAIKQAK